MVPRYSYTPIPGGLAIPDNTLLGITDTATVAIDLEIADLDFRVDSLTQPSR